MTIGISINDLLKIDPWQYDNQQDVLNAILDKCTDLNPWLPIEQAPKGRKLLIKFIDGYISVNDLEHITGMIATHYQELPADPE